MATPEVILLTADDVKIRFTFQSCGFFTASLVPSSFGCDPITIISDVARIQSSTASRFEIYFDKALFEFPHSELEKFKEFLSVVEAVKDAA
ncbi:hypothetical protein [Cellvibrio sp.]|uniref:hypothetical protein n=1 Tax=Cellvibrio sp. TaxID=1965322 RepID=UPI00396475FB